MHARGQSDLLHKMKTWSCKSNWSRNLNALIYQFNMTLPGKMKHLDLPVKWKNQYVMMPWPTLPLSAWVDCIFKKTLGQPILGGNKLDDEQAWTSMFLEFWTRFRAAKGDTHEVFTDHPDVLQHCIPVMLHGDEGRGKLRRAVMATSVQPAIIHQGHAGHSFNSRFLHSIMPGELYAGDSTLNLLQEALVEDLREVYTEGFKAPGFCTIWWLLHACTQGIGGHVFLST